MMRKDLSWCAAATRANLSPPPPPTLPPRSSRSASRLCCCRWCTSPATPASSATSNRPGSSSTRSRASCPRRTRPRARAEALPVITDYRDRGCPEPAPLPPELIKEMMDWAVCESVPDEYLPLLARGDGPRRRRPAPAGSAGLRPCRAGPGGRHRLRRVGAPGRYSAAAGQHSVHHRREERRPGRNMVGEHLSRGARRRRQPLLLLQLRAQQPVDALLRRAARAAGYFDPRDGQARPERPRALADRSRRRRVGRRGRHVDGHRCARTTRASPTMQARAVITAVGQLNRPHIPDFTGANDVSRARRSTPRRGTTRSTSPASASR